MSLFYGRLGCFVLHVRLAGRCTWLGSRGLVGHGRTTAGVPYWHWWRSEPPRLNNFVCAASTAVHSCVSETSGLQAAGPPDVFFVRQNVKHFDVFMTASVRLSGRRPPIRPATSRSPTTASLRPRKQIAVDCMCIITRLTHSPHTKSEDVSE